MYDPETYPWTQADPEDYDSNASPEEQAEMLAARKQYAAQLIAGMRSAVATVPSYFERYAPCCEECGARPLSVDGWRCEACHNKVSTPAITEVVIVRGK